MVVFDNLLPPYKKLQIEFAREAAYRMSLIEVRLGGWGSEGPTLGRHVSACATILRLRALLYLRALVYCNFLREVRLGGWGSEGPKGPTLGQYVSACAIIPLGSGSM